MLSFQNFTSLVQMMAAAVQGACGQLLNLTVGSVLRAILEANAVPAMWLQYLQSLLYNRQRLATCVGADVDSFVNDFGMEREQAVAATGSVSFQRFSPVAAAQVFPGYTVATGGLTEQFTVVQVTTNALWNASQGCYVIPAGTTSGLIPCQAVTAGTGGNVQAGTITLITQTGGIPYVDTVNNPSAFTGGLNAQTDAQVKAAFPIYMASLSKATQAAIANAISSVQLGLTYTINANTNPTGTFQPGFITIAVDNGSGTVSASLLSAITTAVQQVIGLTIGFTVQAAQTVSASISFTLNVATGVTLANVAGTVNAAVTAYVNALPVGATLYYSMLTAAIVNSLPAGQITSVEALSVNGGTSDVVATVFETVVATSVAVN